MITAIIVDDELAARETLKYLLKENCPDISIVGMAGSVDEAQILFENLQPSLIFLDIEMPEKNGFQLLEKLKGYNYDVIFVTAFNQYAIKAIRYAALDYLLKPIDIDELIDAVRRVSVKKTDQSVFQLQIQALVDNMENNSPKKLGINVANGIEFINTDDIIYCQADGGYTTVFLNNGKKILAAKSLNELEISISSDRFLRSHRSYLVNSTFVKKYIRTEGLYLVLKDDKHIEVSRRRKAEVDAALLS